MSGENTQYCKYKHILLYSLLYEGCKEPKTIIKDNYPFCACQHAYACVVGSFSLSLCLLYEKQISHSDWLSDGAILPARDTGFVLH